MKIQKIEIIKSLFPTNGAILDFFVKSLEIKQRDLKLYQRFVKEENISVDEFYKIFEIVLDSIFEVFEMLEYNQSYFKQVSINFLNYFTTVKRIIPTDHSVQKQLDFLIVMDIFIPFVVYLNNLNNKVTLENMLPTEQLSSLVIVFQMISKDFIDKNKTLYSYLYEILDDEKLISYDAIYKNINNWLNGKTIPTMEHINIISKLAKYTKNFTQLELKRVLLIAKVLQNLYIKSIEYFGNELTRLMIEHFKLMLKGIDYSLPLDEKIVSNYNFLYITSSRELFTIFLKDALNPDIYYYQNRLFEEIILEKYDFKRIFYKLHQKVFFNSIDTIYPIKYLQGKMRKSELKQLFYANDEYGDRLYEIFIKTDPSIKKEKQIELEIKKELDDIERVYEIDGDPYFNFLKARYFAQLGEIKLAEKHYLMALKDGKNAMGCYILDVIKEGLMVSSLTTREKKVNLLNAKNSFTKFYKEAYFYKVIDKKPEEVNTYLLLDLQKGFDLHFNNLFDGIKENKDFIISQNIGFCDNTKYKIDFNNANKIVKIFINDLSQLIYCVVNRDLESIEKLLFNGADVNYLKVNDNATALIIALQNYEMQEDYLFLKIAKLLIPKMDKKALNMKLEKKLENPLAIAIRLGLVEIVQLLLENGADVEKRVTTDNFTALFLVINCINLSKSKKVIEENSKFNIVHPLEYKDIRKKFETIFNMNGVFDNEQQISLEKFVNMTEICNDEILKLYKKNKENYVKIFSLIVEVSQNLNITVRHDITALIQATEHNEENLVIKLLEKGADKSLKTVIGHTAYDYALTNRNYRLMGLL